MLRSEFSEKPRRGQHATSERCGRPGQDVLGLCESSLDIFTYILYVMVRYEVRIAASADKDLAGVPRVLGERIIEKFGEISKDPRGTDSKKLKMQLIESGLGTTGSCTTLMIRSARF